MSRPLSGPYPESAASRGRLADLWQHGVDLFTRLALLKSQGAPVEGVDPAEGLGDWARAFARGDRAALDRRLSWDGIAPEHAALALGDSEAGAPSLTEAEMGLLDEVEIQSPILAESGALTDLAPELPFAEILEPWRAAARGIWSELPEARLVSPRARLDLERVLLDQLAAASEQTLYERFTHHRLSDPAPGLYRRFVDEMLRSHLLALYSGAPCCSSLSRSGARLAECGQ